MALDSEASFRSRCLTCGLPENVVQEMNQGGITTFAGLAFCTPHQANAGIDDAALMTHVNSLLSQPLSPTAVAALRRVAFEAQALALQDLKTKLESSGETEAKVLPLQEKMARITRQKERLVGVVLTPHNTPSHSLIDKACSQLEEGALQWIHPNKCTSRHSEALAEKPKASLSFDARGSIKVSSAASERECDTSSAHLLRVALQRRALAYDVANLFRYDIIERWHQSLFDRLHHEPPPGYLAPSLHQIVAADKALWLLVSEGTRAKLSEMDPDSSSLRLCESHMNWYSDHPDVLFHIMPLKAGSSAGGSNADATHPQRKRGGRRANQGASQKAVHQDAGKKDETPAYTPIVVPDDCEIMFNNGKPICKKFNVGRCKVKTTKGVGVGQSGSFTTGAYSFAGEACGIYFALFPFYKCGSFNLVAPLSQFQNGHIWCESPEGDHYLSIDEENVPGYLLPVADRPVWLPASSARHCTMDWVGDRVVLVAFSIKEALELPHAVADHLKRLEFRCPASATSLTLCQPLQSRQSAPRGSAVSAPQNQLHGTLTPLMIEICSGSGVLSAAFRDVGFRTLAIDRPGNEHRLSHSYVPLNLADPGNQDLLMQSLEDALFVGHIHLGVPCGTCSRARERALPSQLRARHAAPRPLRDAKHPLGKPALAGADKTRVKTANELYKFALRVVLWAFRHDIPVTIENPARSWLWPALDCLVKKMRPIFGHDLRRAWASLKFYDLDACMFGGKRKKRTSTRLAFDTAEEAQYPRGLCLALARTFAVKFENDGGLLRPPGDFSSARTGPGRDQRPLVQQFRATLVAPQVPPGDQFKLLASPTGDISQVKEHTDGTGDLKTFGVRWTPQEFLQQAKSVEHPMNPEQALSDLLKDVIFANLTTPPVELAKSRIQAVVTIRQMAADLESKEHAFKEKLDPLVAKILKPKRILLWKSLLLAANYDDMEIVDLVSKGIPLTGSHGAVPALPEKLVPATDSVESLLAASELRRKALTSSGKVTSDKEQEDLTEASNEEVRRGELEGPFSEEEVTQHFGSKEWLLNPRFALYQGVKMKLRVIDDAKRSGLNEAFQRTCAATFMDLDALTCLLATIAKAMVDGKFQGVDVDDQVKAEQWLGRTLDLSRAYKQLPIDPASRRVCVLGFLKQGRWVYYRCNVLPFGARASVFSFLRVSRSLHFIMAKYLQALNTVFFDDFPMVSTSGGSKILQKAASAILNLLGWAHAEEGEKAPGFQSDFVALGVQVVLKDIGRGLFKVQNKPGRVEKLVSMIEEAASKPDVAKALDAEEALYPVQVTGINLFKIARDLPATSQAPALGVRRHVHNAADGVPEPQVHIGILREGLALMLDDLLGISIIVRR
ncbi:unnamed protein product [Symbiodinium sp. KB8]|nr:unnamed protein product [Symbiodinium sp. KB8]